MLAIIPIPAFKDNYIWLLKQNHYVAAVDPGDGQTVLKYIQQNNLQLTAILLTHHHFDHVDGVKDLVKQYPVRVYGPKHETMAAVTHPLTENDQVELSELALNFKVIEIPGHTAGHIAYYAKPYLFCGDTLFAGGCGRIFEGTPLQLFQSLSKLAALPDRTQVFCAHEYTLNNLEFALQVEPDNNALQQRYRQIKALREKNIITLPSLLRDEKQTNPFLRCEQNTIKQAAESYAATRLSNPAAVFKAIREWKDSF